MRREGGFTWWQSVYFSARHTEKNTCYYLKDSLLEQQPGENRGELPNPDSPGY